MFRSHIVLSTGRLLQDGVIICVGKSEVYDFHIATIVCHEYISRLKVAVQYLLAVDVGQSIYELVHDLATGGLRGIA